MSDAQQSPPEGEPPKEPQSDLWVFPAWHNKVPSIFFLVIGPVVTVLAIGAVWYYFSPKFTDVGYRPEQPVAYSHKLHAGDLGIDCRYCHTSVERTAHAGVPPTQTCMNCHAQVKKDSPKLLPVRESWATGEPIPWVRVHKTPDYAYFDHSAHTNAAIGCETCHGRVDQMVEVTQNQPLNMEWCTNCHIAPQEHLRPKSELTTMGYKTPANQDEIAKSLIEQHDLQPPIHCSGCHR